MMLAKTALRIAGACAPCAAATFAPPQGKRNPARRTPAASAASALAK